ncbi:MAG: alternative ribosome rescue aminoacyl-tRNA hydrolase ArfB [Defluviicoccus sp.]|nr:alternative ribosome rescue aminoacyl-tRNA hydrolase ArfB [Defluviicoccus sp.]MDG4592678.1 alternative ribosome rescue aminoacyl-tRNA hydrolase ArfB [Defluviicoccus sp.]
MGEVGAGATSRLIVGDLVIDSAELEERFVRSGGPGGQNVNKVATAVQLRFDVRHSPSLPVDVRARLERLAGRMVSRDGVLIITAQRFRTQERNRQDALERLLEWIRRALIVPRSRRPTRPSAAAVRNRLDAKRRRATLKARRREGSTEE